MTRHVERVPIGSLCLKVTTGGTPSRANPRYWEKGTIPWFKTGELKDWYVDDAEERITEEGLAESAAKIFPPNTVLMALYGDGKTITSLGLLRSEATTNQACCAMIVDTTCCHFLYLFYALKCHRHELLKLVVAGAQRNLSNSIVRGFTIPYHPLSVQQRVVSILATYDDLIENNARRTAILEQAARLLYVEWFIRLRFPGREHARIVDGVPDGWRRQRLSVIAEVNRESLPGRFNGEIEYVDIAAVMPGQIGQTTVHQFRDAPSRARRVVHHGDIIWSCVRPNRRSHAVVWQPPLNLIVSTGFAVLTPTGVPTSFLYYATTTDAFAGYLANRARGAAYPAVVAGDFEQAEILVPPASLLKTFDEFVQPILAQIHNLRVQSQKAKEARDLLLPRLMSGEIVV